MKNLLVLFILSVFSISAHAQENWEKQAFERFFQKAQSMSGSRSSKGNGGFKYSKGPLKNKTLDEGREWCLSKWKGMSDSDKRKYYQESTIVDTKPQPRSKQGDPVVLKVGDTFSINGNRGPVGNLKVNDDETIIITLNIKDEYGRNIPQQFRVKVKN